MFSSRKRENTLRLLKCNKKLYMYENVLGMMRYSTKMKEIEYCDGNKWLPLIQPGNSLLMPALSCKQIALEHNLSFNNGQYWIKPSVSDPPFKVKQFNINKL